MKYLNKIISFRSPPKNEVVVLHERHINRIKKLILSDIPFFTYCMDYEKFYISFSVVINFIKLFPKFNWNEFSIKNIKIRELLTLVLNNYRLATIQYINPKIVITFIDNSGLFHWLSRKCRDIEFFAIQNGGRLNHQLEESSYYYHQHFFCFGDYEKEHYDRFGLYVQNFYPVGSFLADYHKKSNTHSIKYDLCIVSVWPPNNKRMLDTIELMDTYLARYINDYKINAIVSLRYTGGEQLSNCYYGHYSNEEDYYNRIYGNTIQLHERDQDNLSVYDIMSYSEVSIGFLTTSIREAYGWGKKALYCDFTGTKDYCDYEESLLFTQPNYKVFSKTLNNLIHESNDEYAKRNKEYASYLMHYDSKLPTHKAIRKKIKEYL